MGGLEKCLIFIVPRFSDFVYDVVPDHACLTDQVAPYDNLHPALLECNKRQFIDCKAVYHDGKDKLYKLCVRGAGYIGCKEHPNLCQGSTLYIKKANGKCKRNCIKAFQYLFTSYNVSEIISCYTRL